MQDDDKLEILLERFYSRFNKYNTKVLEKLGETIKKFDGLTPSQAHILSEQLKSGQDIDELTQELSKITNKSVKELYEVYEATAKDNLEFSEVFYKAKGKEYIDYKNNESLQKYVKSLAKQGGKNLKNLTKSKAVGFVLKENNKATFKPLKKVYNDLLDEAVYSVSSGQEDYQSAMRNIIKELANSGVKTHEEKVGYKSGYNRRLDSSVRQQVLDGVKQINLDVQKRVGEDFGADGVEISHHGDSAEDHYIIDGKQFTNKQFERINDSLDRPVGELNCRHFVFSIVIGVSLPQYTQKQLDEDWERNQKGFEYEGKHYTRYDGNQLMRKIETSIRKNKDLQIISRESGNKELVEEAQNNIKKLTDKYYEISKIGDLPTYKEKLVVSGYRKVNPKNVK